MNVSNFKQRYKFVDTFHLGPPTATRVFGEQRLEYLKLCFVIHLFWIGSLRQHASGLLAFSEEAWKVVGPHVTHVRDNKKRRQPVKLTKTTFETVRAWLQDPDHAPPMMALMDFFNKTFD
jgi:hypothetical protein